MQWISRRTRLWFVAMLFSLFFGLFETWREGGPCQRLTQVHAAVIQEDQVAFSPCWIEREVPLIDKINACVFFISVVATLSVFYVDLVGFLKSRRKA